MSAYIAPLEAERKVCGKCGNKISSKKLLFPKTCSCKPAQPEQMELLPDFE